MSLLNRFIDGIKVLWEQVYPGKGEADDHGCEMLEGPIPEIEIKRVPGVDCPVCSYRIQVSIPMLLSGDPIMCPQCSLELIVDKEQSKGALDATRSLYEVIQNTEEVKRGNT